MNYYLLYLTMDYYLILYPTKEKKKENQIIDSYEFYSITFFNNSITWRWLFITYYKREFWEKKNKKVRILLVFIDPVSFDAVVKSETRCLPTPRDVSTGSIVAFCRRSADTVFGPIVSRIK